MEFSDDSPPENFTNFLDAINKSLGPLDMEIRRGISEDDGTVHYGLVSLAKRMTLERGQYPGLIPGNKAWSLQLEILLKNGLFMNETPACQQVQGTFNSSV